MASGLVCGFSCVVRMMLHRPRDIRSGKWETWEFVQTHYRKRSSWASF